MKDTDIENPEILVKDERILELDKIVREVKESEEWEAVEMNILEIGIEKGKAEGIKAFVEVCKELGLSREETTQKLITKFSITPEQALENTEKYWK